MMIQETFQPEDTASAIAPVVRQEATEATAPWYAVRLFMVQTQQVTDYLDEHGVHYFVPMEYVDYEDKDHRIRHKLRPVVRNLIFIRKDKSERTVRRLLAAAPFKNSVFRKNKENAHYYEIPSMEMKEFQAMCNPEIAMREFLSEEQAKLKVGTPVYVRYGPLKGLSGRLVRSNKKYFLLKEVPGMGVMLKVARWCCQSVKE